MLFFKCTVLCFISLSVSAVAGSGLASIYLFDPDLRSAELPTL